MNNKLKLLLIILLCSIGSYAQTYKVSGKIVDSANVSIPGFTVILQSRADSTQKFIENSKPDGTFEISGLKTGMYKMTGRHLTFSVDQRPVFVENKDVSLGKISVSVININLKAVNIEGKIIGAEQKGDTTNYNADAYKVNKDASTEDLVTKMPGVTMENGQIKAHGETVKRVLVDGKPFFGDDPSVALKNLPAEIVDKIQVYDRASDQSMFTGFDDGNSQKTMNIITKGGKNNGVFGKYFGGVGDQGRFNAGGNLNFFNKDRRITLLGLSNNINQQNFSIQDILGVSGNMRMMGMGMGGGGRGQGGGGGGAGGGIPDFSNLLAGQQAGVSTTNSIGINYTDVLSTQLKVNASYFLNASDNTNITDLERLFIAQSQSGMKYNESKSLNNNNINHRFNARFEWTIDSVNSLVFTPRYSYQTNTAFSNTNGLNVVPTDVPLSNTFNKNGNDNSGFNGGANLLFQHKYAKKGRTVSLNASVNSSNRETTADFYSLNNFINRKDSVAVNQILDQISDQTVIGNTFSGTMNYTEPLTQYTQLQISHTSSVNQNLNDKHTYDIDTVTRLYSSLNNLLTSKLDFAYHTLRPGAAWKYSKNKVNLSIGADVQKAYLSGIQTSPIDFTVKREFLNVLPSLQLNWKQTATKNLRVNYRTSTNAPSITQLQPILNNTNPLLLSIGDTTLKQEYSHNVNARYSSTNISTGKLFFGMLMASITNNYIANSTLIPTSDTTIGSVFVKRGQQLTRPTNLEGNKSIRSYLTYGFGMRAIKSTVNLNGGFSWTSTPGLVNNIKNTSDNYTITGGAAVNSNISTDLDFSITYNGNYAIVKNSLQVGANNNYFFHNTNFKLNYVYKKRWVLNTNMTQTLYTGLGTGFNQSFWLWNNSIAYKMLKTQSLEVKASVFDMLGQNNSVSRNITETYVEDTRTNVLTRYYMLTLTYTLRKFKAPPAPSPQEMMMKYMNH